jgi:hypothetical protein
MSNLGRTNPGNRSQLTDCVFSMTFVAFRRLSISVADVMYICHVTSASEVGWCADNSLEKQSVKTLLVWIAHLSSNKEVGSADRVCREYPCIWLFSQDFIAERKLAPISSGIPEVSSLRSIHKTSNGKRQEWNSKPGFDHDLRFDYLLFIYLRNYFYLLFDIYLYYSILFIFNQ